MTKATPRLFSDPGELSAEIVARIGPDIRLALPLGIGKANHIVNALYRHACQDSSITLTIYTALTLEKPQSSSDLQRRFLEPLVERLYAGYPDLLYAEALRRGNLPDNIRIHEFFLTPGRWLNTDVAQQNYQSVNYTHVLPALLRSRINVLAQLLAPAPTESDPNVSLSSNPDISVDLLEARRAGQIDFLATGQLNHNLPFMGGAALRHREEFDLLLDSEDLHYPLFSLPQEPVSLQDHAIGLHVARLIPDGGTLQIGIGSIGDAICHALFLRHRQNESFVSLLEQLIVDRTGPDCFDAPLNSGLYSATEMLVEGFPMLLEEGVLRREVDGVVLHGGFFLGSQRFYKTLNEMPDRLQAKIAMMPISFTNALFGDEQGRRHARRDARFVNSAMMATLLGAVVSDGLGDGKVVSGVGGQYNFVAMAHALEGARSIITLPATRMRRGKPVSNIVWSYPHQTIPRHLRDMVVTEYGVADLRDKSDAEVIQEMLRITDARFQEDLLKEARDAGKLPAHFSLPAAWQENLPGTLTKKLQPARASGLLPLFPLGCDFTPVEAELLPALRLLKGLAGTKLPYLRMILRGWTKTPDSRHAACLERLSLASPKSLRDKVLRALVLEAMHVVCEG